MFDRVFNAEDHKEENYLYVYIGDFWDEMSINVYSYPLGVHFECGGMPDGWEDEEGLLPDITCFFGGKDFSLEYFEGTFETVDEVIDELLPYVSVYYYEDDMGQITEHNTLKELVKQLKKDVDKREESNIS